MAYITGAGVTVTVDTVEVAQVQRVRLPTREVETTEVDLLGNANDYTDKVATRVTFGNLEITVAYDPAQHEGSGKIGTLAGTIFASAKVVEVKKGQTTLGKFNCVAINAGDLELTRRGIAERTYTCVISSPAP